MKRYPTYEVSRTYLAHRNKRKNHTEEERESGIRHVGTNKNSPIKKKELENWN